MASGSGGKLWDLQSAPWWSVRDVTKSDSDDLKPVARGLYIGTGGDVSVEFVGGGSFTFKNVPDGTQIPAWVKRVNATGTTASDIGAGC